MVSHLFMVTGERRYEKGCRRIGLKSGQPYVCITLFGLIFQFFIDFKGILLLILFIPLANSWMWRIKDCKHQNKNSSKTATEIKIQKEKYKITFTGMLLTPNNNNKNILTLIKY